MNSVIWGRQDRDEHSNWRVVGAGQDAFDMSVDGLEQALGVGKGWRILRIDLHLFGNQQTLEAYAVPRSWTWEQVQEEARSGVLRVARVASRDVGAPPAPCSDHAGWLASPGSLLQHGWVSLALSLEDEEWGIPAGTRLEIVRELPDTFTESADWPTVVPAGP